MNKAYWAIVNHFDLALNNDDLPLELQKKWASKTEKA